MSRTRKLITATGLVCVITGGTATGLVVTASAGVSPPSFATVAKNAINSYDNSVYGKSGNPWVVNCSEKPDSVQPVPETVTCKITLKLSVYGLNR